MKTNEICEISTEVGIIRIWKDFDCFEWATPNGSQGSAFTFESAIAESFSAEELNPKNYGY